MHRIQRGALLCALLIPACARPGSAPRPETAGLQPFTSSAELRAYLTERPPAPRPVPPAPSPPPVAPAPTPATPAAPAPAPAAGRADCRPDSAAQAGTLWGVVRDIENGAPLAGVQLRIQGTPRATVTDAAGRYAVQGVAPGRYTVSAAMIGRQPGACSVDLARGARADFVLGIAAVALEGVVVQGLTATSHTRAAHGASVSVTNVQHQGVDEGGIVKVHGEHLVILRRGRLFTVRIGDDRLRPVSTVDAYAPGIDPSGAWYDELLVSGNTVVVIGYSYRRTGTEIGLFRIDASGRLEHRSTHHLRSDDYYSSRNYTSRLVDGKLIFYTPLQVRPRGNPLASLPAIRRWSPSGGGGFRPIATAQRVYRPARGAGTPGRHHTLHTVTVCDLARDDLDCDATVVVAGWGRVFYASPTAVYVWTRHYGRGTSALVYRIPLNGSRPTALGATGMPIDQFSFLEEAGHLNVLVRSEGRGEAMWGAERPAPGDLALLRVPLGAFGDGSADAPQGAYRPVPAAPGPGVLQNRFVDRHLLYGLGNGWGSRRVVKDRAVHVVPLAGGDARTLPLAHAVDRIEALGADALVVGTDSTSLHFSGIRLSGEPRVVHRYVRPDASQGETRSHGFFYRQDDESTGVLGLPIRGAGQPGWRHLVHGSASVLYLRNTGRAFWELGDLAARPEAGGDDRCRASCVDWYGNARPLFIRDRVFALLGYELVEGRIDDRGIHEIRRISYAPRGGARARTGE